ncbi:hypothetical protein INT48_004208, partial [Thamnidium elegans]
MSSIIPRSRGRVTGQVVSTYRSRVLDGDVLELARMITLERGDIWTVLKDHFRAFDRQPDARCGIQGCIHYPTLWWREEREQWYLYCGGGYSIGDDGSTVGHNGPLRRTITNGSMFYRKKMILQYMISAMYQFFQGGRITDVLRGHSHLHTNIIECLWRDLKVFIGPRYRNSKDCPGKIVEYLWRYANRGSFINGMKRCIREVQVVHDGTVGGEGSVPFTAGQDGEDLEAQERRLRREERMFDQWVSRRRERDEDEAVLSESDGDNDDPRADEDYIPARGRVPRPTNLEEPTGDANQQVEDQNVRRRPARQATNPASVASRGRPSRGSRGRGRPRGSAS